MRRPPPLPAPPAGPAAPAESVSDAAAADANDAVVYPIAPSARVTPLADRDVVESRVEDAGVTAPVTPAGPASRTAPADPVEPTPDDIGVREVWAAARARRRALRAEVRRFTVRQRRRRMLWLGVAGSLVLLVLGSLGAAYSPLFAVERISVVGSDSLAPKIEKALAGQVGTPLPLVDSSAVKAALVQFPLIESYALEARPPHELVVRVVERTPIGSLKSAAGYTLVDAAGVALDTTATPSKKHPVITAAGGTGSPAFEAIGTVYRSLPADIRDQVTKMKATTANDVTLTLGGTDTTVVWGGADRSAYKAVVLAKAMTANPPQRVSSYDVSSPDVVVVR